MRPRSASGGPGDSPRREAAESALKLRRSRWSSPESQEKQWRSTLERYVNPTLGAMPISAITTAHVLSVLEPVQETYPKLVSIVRERMGVVFKWAVGKGLRTGNPAAADVIADVLGPPPDVVHHRALPHTEVAAALARARNSDTWVGTRGLFEFVVLTSVRTNEARGARWSEIDVADGRWVIPAGRMKERREHEVPLSTPALALLEEARTCDALCAARLREEHPDLVFPSEHGRPLYNNALSNMLRKLQIAAVPHGFRSSFRDWCGETGVPFEVAEICLSHVVGNQVTEAYRRTRLYNLRVQVMEDWGTYVAPANREAAQERS